MALLKRGRGGTSNQLQIAAQGRYRLEGWNGAKLERVVGMKTGEAPTSLLSRMGITCQATKGAHPCHGKPSS
jgi:hypothetical protein